MEWRDEGIVLSSRRHGESAAIVSLLTRRHGRHAGLVRGRNSLQTRGVLQPGTLVDAHWRARLAAHLGHYRLEGGTAWAARLYDDRARLDALQAACAMIDATVPEQQPHPELHEALGVLLAALAGDSGWPAVYVRWEMGLLAVLGYGLDLSCCAVTGVTEDLSHVSPNSGRAVCGAVAAPYGDRLLRLPAFLAGPPADPPPGDISAGLTLTGHFFERHIFASDGNGLPAARDRLADQLAAQ